MTDWMSILCEKQRRIDGGSKDATIDEVISDMVEIGLQEEFDGFVP